MILIADSGSTKTDWCVVEHGKSIQRIFTKGMNPYFQSKAEIESEVAQTLLPRLVKTCPQAIYFYGAGCTYEKLDIVKDALQINFPGTTCIEISTDILAAARGLCGHSSGIACIMGTGSNSCYYDGEKISENVSPLGYILGDEGSGAVLGKLLVGDILKNQVPQTVKNKFFAQFQLTHSDIIEQVYRKPFPNRFLASLSPFLLQNLDEPCIYSLVLNSFKAFFQRNIMQYDYKNCKVHFIGSVAFHYKAVLQEAAYELGIELGTIVQSPMEGLIAYHQE